MTELAGSARRSPAFLLTLVMLGLVAVASLALVPLEAGLPEGIEVPRAVLLIQPAVLVLGGALLGWFMAPRLGLDAPVIGALVERGEWGRPFARTLLPALAGGMAAAAIMLAYALATRDLFLAQAPDIELPVVTRVLYGGIGEEIMTRWGLMSGLAALALWLGLRREAACWAGNACAALLFGLGHLPTLFALLGTPPGWLVVLVVAANTAIGLIFGWLFIRRGLEAAMIGHAAAHILVLAGAALVF